MRTEVVINGTATTAANYVSWSPSPCTVRLTDLTGVTGPVPVTLRNQRTDVGGQVAFYADRNGAASDSLALTLPPDGAPVSFHAGGEFGRPSTENRDAAIEVARDENDEVLSVTQLMVRVRKNATALTDAERNRFIAALATLNNRGMGRFSDFRDMHTSAADDEAHRFAGFLPWHRAYILDLERELQNIDPSVALPYWRFDQPAPGLFTPEFLGRSNTNGTVIFGPANPLAFWRTDGTLGVDRLPLFNTQTGRPSVRTENQTLNLGPNYQSFVTMQGNPHGSAHVSFSGYIDSPGTAPKDPLFFLLHANVDRLWAKWQWINRRYDFSIPTYQFLGSAGSPGATRIGHNWNDTMWPWNSVTGSPRPPTAPGGSLASSPLTSAPGGQPRVSAMIDYQGVLAPLNRLGFDYDDVPFEV